MIAIHLTITLPNFYKVSLNLYCVVELTNTGQITPGEQKMVQCEIKRQNEEMTSKT